MTIVNTAATGEEHSMADEAPKKIEEASAAPPVTVVETPPLAAVVKPEDVPITVEQFYAEVEKLFTRARKSGLSPVQMVLATSIGQSRSVIDDFFGALSGSLGKKV